MVTRLKGSEYVEYPVHKMPLDFCEKVKPAVIKIKNLVTLLPEKTRIKVECGKLGYWESQESVYGQSKSPIIKAEDPFKVRSDTKTCE